MLSLLSIWKSSFYFNILDLFEGFFQSHFSESFEFETDFIDQLYSQQTEILLVVFFIYFLTVLESEKVRRETPHQDFLELIS